MIYAKYQTDFATLYPNYGPSLLMGKYGITRKKASKIAHVLKIRRLPRDKRTCWRCPKPLVDVPAYTGNYCMGCFKARRKKQGEALVQHLRIRFFRAKNRAKKKNIIFNLTQEHLLDLWEKQGQRCFYSDVKMSITGRQRNPYGVSLDRVLPEEGYVIGNVVLCCWGVNTAKQEFTLTEFLHLCQKVTENSRLQKAVKLLDGACREKSPGDSSF